MTVRTVFVIDNNKKVRLKLTSGHQVATPVNWKHGEKVIILPSLSTEQAKEKWPQGWDEQKPYLRYVPDPTD